jgi:hypothetical protein
MIFPIQNTLLIAILGAILLYSYYYFSKLYPSSIEKLWGNIKGKTRQFYYYSIAFCFIAYIFIFLYFFTKKDFDNDTIYKITLAISGMIIASIIWMPLSIQYLKNKIELLRVMIILTLLLVSLFAFYLIIIIQHQKETDSYKKILKNIALLGSCYFFFQVFVLDFVYWNFQFLFAKN